MTNIYLAEKFIHIISMKKCPQDSFLLNLPLEILTYFNTFNRVLTRESVPFTRELLTRVP